VESYWLVGGTIAELWRFPVKSMAGEQLTETAVGPEGLEGDRRYAFIDSAANRGDKPLTGRQLKQLLAYRARVVAGSVEVLAPGGRRLDMPAAHAEIQDLAGRPLALRDSHGSNYDDAHLLILSLATLDRFEAEHGSTIDRRRFRGNALVAGLAADEEVAWLGRPLRLGSAILEAQAMCERCVMITIDPEDQSSDPAILKTLARERMTLMGVYCRVISPGWARVGDSLEVG
jgi:uncharacterized protein YcbX